MIYLTRMNLFIGFKILKIMTKNVIHRHSEILDFIPNSLNIFISIFNSVSPNLNLKIVRNYDAS